MDKTFVLFLCGMGVGLFVGTIEFDPEPENLEPHKKIIIAGTTAWLILHYIIALVTIPVIAIEFLKKRFESKRIRYLPISFNLGFFFSSLLIGLIGILTTIFT